MTFRKFSGWGKALGWASFLETAASNINMKRKKKEKNVDETKL